MFVLVLFEFMKIRKVSNVMKIQKVTTTSNKKVCLKLTDKIPSLTT